MPSDDPAAMPADPASALPVAGMGLHTSVSADAAPAVPDAATALPDRSDALLHVPAGVPSDSLAAVPADPTCALRLAGRCLHASLSADSGMRHALSLRPNSRADRLLAASAGML